MGLPECTRNDHFQLSLEFEVALVDGVRGGTKSCILHLQLICSCHGVLLRSQLLLFEICHCHYELHKTYKFVFLNLSAAILVENLRKPCAVLKCNGTRVCAGEVQDHWKHFLGCEGIIPVGIKFLELQENFILPCRILK